MSLVVISKTCLMTQSLKFRRTRKTAKKNSLHSMQNRWKKIYKKYMRQENRLKKKNSRRFGKLSRRERNLKTRELRIENGN